jgi:hypothetical protein
MSALMCITAGVFWVRSYFTGEALSYTLAWFAPRSVVPGWHSEYGRATISVAWFNPEDPGHYGRSLQFDEHGPRWNSWNAQRNVPRAGWQEYGYHPDDINQLNRRGYHEICLTLPHWLLVLVFGVLPTVRLTRFIRRRRQHREGCCQTCGYDLRATPDRCPECGAVPSVPSPIGRGSG